MLAAMVASATLAGAVPAQSSPSFFGPNGQPIRNEIVSTNPSSSIGGVQFFQQNRNPQRYLSGDVGRISNQQVIGRSIFPTYEQLPNENYLKPFRVQRHPRLTPVPWFAWLWPF
jgi:hypothetical protein